MPGSNPLAQAQHLRARGHLVPLAPRALIMGILNVTPDSFSDGGRYIDPQAAIDHASNMVAEGADLIDIGAESSRPGSEPVGDEEEIRRLMPVVEAVCKKLSVPISVDTTKAGVARRALDAGASIINDISALRFDPSMAGVVASSGAGVILMHMQGTPKTMQQDPQYKDVVLEVREFLSQRLAAAQQAGIGRDQILLDPGFGFGKTVEHNLTLLSQLEDLSELGRPLVVGVSRKAFIGQVLGRGVESRFPGAAAAVAVALQRGARVVRVHEVGPIRDVVRMVEAIVPRSGSALSD